jgi:hypothetical protein
MQESCILPGKGEGPPVTHPDDNRKDWLFRLTTVGAWVLLAGSIVGLLLSLYWVAIPAAIIALVLIYIGDRMKGLAGRAKG